MEVYDTYSTARCFLRSADELAAVEGHTVNMAASSSGVEWSQLVKPILAASYGSANKQDLPELVKAILKRWGKYTCR